MIGVGKQKKTLEYNRYYTEIEVRSTNAIEQLLWSGKIYYADLTVENFSGQSYCLYANGIGIGFLKTDFVKEALSKNNVEYTNFCVKNATTNYKNDGDGDSNSFTFTLSYNIIVVQDKIISNGALESAKEEMYGLSNTDGNNIDNSEHKTAVQQQNSSWQQNNYRPQPIQIDTESIDAELQVWNNYIDILCERAENSGMFFRAEQYHITESSRLVINISDSNKGMSILNSLKGSEITLYYNNKFTHDDEGEEDDVVDLDDFSSNEFDRSDRIGTLRTYNTKNKTITIELNETYLQQVAYGDFDFLPKVFYGEISASGDIVQYNRLSKGIKQLKYQLNSRKTDIYRALLFCKDKEIVQNLEPIDYIDGDILSTSFLSDTLNDSQKEAVIMALSTKNTISLIQGPPGTGKTTVIAEICYQNAIRGKKTLIASQSNLAIDNALSRLVYSKEIIPIRAGNLSRVDVIGEKYVPDRIVRTLFDGSIEQCKKKMNQEYYRKRTNEIDELISDINKYNYRKSEIEVDIEKTETEISECNFEIDELGRNICILQNLVKECDYSMDLLSNSEMINEFNISDILLNAEYKYKGELSGKIQDANKKIADIGTFIEDSKINKDAIEAKKQDLNTAERILKIIIECDDNAKIRIVCDALACLPKISENQNETIENAILEYEIAMDDYTNAIRHKYVVNNMIFGLEEHVLSECKKIRYVPFGLDHDYKDYDEAYSNLGSEAKELFYAKPFVLNLPAMSKWTNRMSLLYSKIIDIRRKCLDEINKTERPIFKNNIQYQRALLINALCKITVKAAQNNANNACKQAYKEITMVTNDHAREQAISTKSFEHLNQIEVNYKIGADKLQNYLENIDTVIYDTQKHIKEYIKKSIKKIDEIKFGIKKYDEILSGMINMARDEVKDLQNDFIGMINVFSDLQKKNSRLATDKADSIRIKKNEVALRYTSIMSSLKKILVDIKVLDNTDPNDYIKSLTYEREQCAKNIKQNALLEQWCNSINDFSEDMALELYQIVKANTNVVAITCVQSAGYQFANNFDMDFDTVVIDEVSKAIPPELILPSLKGKSLVLIGDHKQLPPMVDEKTLEEMDESCHDSIKNSVFKVLFENIEPSHKKMLNIQYRMHRQIMNVINCFYDYGLESGWTEDEERKLKSHNLRTKYFNEEVHTLWVDIPNTKEHFEKKDGTSFYNETECRAINKMLADINNAANRKMDVAIISFYGAQVWYLKENINTKQYTNLTIKISTVDRFQGAESEIVLVSTVRNNAFKEIGFARSFERINVAFSRAQKLLGIIGCSSIFTNNKDSNASNTYTNIYNTIDSVDGIIELGRVLK